MRGPLLTHALRARLGAAWERGEPRVECSLDLERSRTSVVASASGFEWNGASYAFPDPCRERTVYHWSGTAFEPAARYRTSLIKLVPTEWGAPTFEIDGIKMLPTARISPYDDAQRKVALVEPAGKSVLDTCGGLGYFAAWCLEGGAARIASFEKSADVLWLRQLNPWSPGADPRLRLEQGDIALTIGRLASGSVDAILHDPPRISIAGELYSQEFYGELARTLRRRGRLFHYTGSPHRVSRGRDLPAEVSRRLRQVGFDTRIAGDGVLAINA